MYRHRVAQSVNRALLDTGSASIIIEQLLDLALLQGTLAAGEEVGSDVSTFTQIAAKQFGRMPPERLLAAEAVFQPPNRDPMVSKVDVVDGEHEGFAHTQAVVVDQAEEGLIAG